MRVTTQLTLTMVPSKAEGPSLARTGVALNWRRVSRRARALMGSQVQQLGELPILATSGFGLQQRCIEAALVEELERGCLRQSRHLKHGLVQQARGRRLSGKVALLCTREGYRAQAVIDQLRSRVGRLL